MNRIILTTAAALMATSALAQDDAAPATQEEAAPTAQASLVGADGETVGEATLTQGPAGVLIHLRAEGLTPGAHGLHLHAVGTCDHEGGFESATGHVGKVEGGHGLLNMDGPEPGDLPNLFVSEEGIGEMEAYTTMVTVEELLDEDGSSFIIHESADDHLSQPIGGAGGRVACGVIEGAA